MMQALIGRFIREDEGQDVIEYALLAAFISIVAATIIQTIGTDVTTITLISRRRPALRPVAAVRRTLLA
jgi:Flp pilus assembly pilin Flp